MKMRRAQYAQGAYETRRANPKSHKSKIKQCLLTEPQDHDKISDVRCGPWRALDLEVWQVKADLKGGSAH